MIELVIVILICLSSLLIIIATCALLRSNDIYTMGHIIMIFNCYLVPLILLAIEVRNFSVMSILKIVTIGILNIVISNIICHLVLKRAMINKIYPDAEIIDKN
ncbi:MAG: hypothetical protein FJX30_02790 [Alphaproteobacteria bacterium]|nr:hypothetical protein [Alphaproteobacteria bacterium]